MDQVIRSISKAFKKSNVRWGVGASKLLSYYGITDVVNDLDIIIHPEDHETAASLLSQLGDSIEIPYKPNYATDHFSRFIVEGVEIDVMSRFKIIYEDGVYTFELDSDLLAPIQNGDIKIPITSLEQWYIAYLLMQGREKKVKMIEDYFLSTKKYNTSLLRRYQSGSFPDDVNQRINSLCTLKETI